MSALLRARRELSLPDGTGRKGRNKTKHSGAGSVDCVALHLLIIAVAFLL